MRKLRHGGPFPTRGPSLPRCLPTLWAAPRIWPLSVGSFVLASGADCFGSRRLYYNLPVHVFGVAPACELYFSGFLCMPGIVTLNSGEISSCSRELLRRMFHCRTPGRLS